MLPICFTHGLALLSHYFKSSTCVCSVIFSLQRRCMGVLCCCFRLPVTMYGTTHANLVHMCWPLSWALHRMGHSFAKFSTYALVGSLRWMTDDGSDAIVQLTGSPTQPKCPRSPTVAEDAVFVSAVKGPCQRCLQRSRWLPPRQEQRLPPSQEQSQPPNGLVWLCKRALKRLPNQPRAPLPPPHQPVQHTPCLSCKLSMCNSSKCVILVPRSSSPFLWILNNICVG